MEIWGFFFGGVGGRWELPNFELVSVLEKLLPSFLSIFVFA